jgi:hypothetical protein
MSLGEVFNNHLNKEFFMKGKTLKGEALCKDIQIMGTHFIIDLDSYHFTERVIKNIFNAGECRKVCDYVIIAEEVVLLCELKSNNVDKARKQLKVASSFISYILDVFESIDKIKKPEIKYVIFSTTGSAKQKTKDNKLESTPFNGSRLYKLRCNALYSINQFT